ncbi:DUF4290 domain-containing protein [Capnocytophaga catalasegens]|uniref:Methionyl-tRNA formyltransferase n=1 Tax=Capnocytophaga catalasegens TaxID=1004260 RepID=A0AAV5AZ66_9FLAO|nr:DUF4290 domain-containing protein [Capnocytophaga catalasegens]GIZ14564.1 hypothetical protein RCZ03_05650 [Capnocytophaga catalasegens]GJM50766.1 hypothetical protein RCZ15_17390 [Capnocytophaga catalasegens]GJM51919.1 hypothetical protein RCZ16_02370 [Capnocytophaga catalasegens]
MEYNTERTPLIIPEYGRHIQKLIQQATTIQDRTERNNVARALIAVMGNLNPHLRDVPDFQHKLWDQLFIMSDFKLDVDSPFEHPTRESVRVKPARLNYPQRHPKYRFYGNNILQMIEVCNSWEEGDLKNALKFAIANHMKKCFLNWNKESVEDEVIFEHLKELSGGKINLANYEEDLSAPKNFQRTKFQRKNNNKKQNNYSNNNNRRKKY